MSDAIITVNAGVCGFKTVITAVYDDMMTADLIIESDCPQVRKMAEGMKSVDVFKAIETPFTENPVYIGANELSHGACPVPCAIIKAVEASAELALKKNVTMTFS